MFKASAGKTLPTSIIGSLPRPSWYTAVLGARSFLEALVNSRYREQYEDAVSVHLRAQETAGLDICTDGDAHYDDEVGGMSWQSYPLRHMAGFDTVAEPAICRGQERVRRFSYVRRGYSSSRSRHQKAIWPDRAADLLLWLQDPSRQPTLVEAGRH
jgi:methionine synthase II (cobalamin-independent)